VKKDIKRLLRAAEKQGFEVDRSTRHYKVTAPDGRVFGVSRSPAGSPALKRIRADFRKHGFEAVA
jgi:hypothetical protein